MLKRIEKGLGYVSLILLCLFVIAFVLVNTASVQKFILEKVTKTANKSLGIQLSFNQVHISPWLDIELKGIKALDKKGDTLLYIGVLKTKLGKLDLALGRYQFKDIKIINPIINDHLYRDDSLSNLRAFFKKITAERPGKAELPLRISGDLSIKNGRFQYRDDHRSNPLRYNFENIDLKIPRIAYRANRLTVRIDSLSMHEAVSGLDIKRLSLKAELSKQSGAIEDFQLLTTHSNIRIPKLSFSAKNAHWVDFDPDYRSVFWDARIDKSSLGLRDLRIFSPGYESDVTLGFSGSVKGTRSDLNIRDLWLKAAAQTAVSGDLKLHLKKGRDYQLEGNFKQLQTGYADLAKMLPYASAQHIPPEVKRAGLINYVGTLQLSPDYLSLDGRLHTALGKLRIQSDFIHYTSVSKARYSGFFNSGQLDIGKLTNNPLLGDISIDIALDGTGLSKAYFNSEINGTINYLELHGYRYKNITAKGSIKKNIFQGGILVDDPNAKLSLRGRADLTSDVYRFNLEANVQKLELASLIPHRLDSVAALSGRIDIAVRGSSLDDAAGSIQFSDLRYSSAHKQHYFKDFKIVSKYDPQGVRRIRINSADLISGQLTGKFKLTQFLPLTTNALGNLFGNYRPLKVDKGQHFSYAFSVYNSAIDALLPGVGLQANTQISGLIDSEQNRFKLHVSTPGIKYKNNVAVGLQVHIDTRASEHNLIKCDKARIQGVALYNFTTKARFAKDTVFLESAFNLLKADRNKLQLNWYQTIDSDHRFIIGFSRSTLSYKDIDWTLAPAGAEDAKLVIEPKRDRFALSGFSLHSGDSKLAVSGSMEGKKLQEIHIDAHSVELADIIPDAEPIQLEGSASGSLEIQNRAGRLDPKIDMRIQGFKFNGVRYGALYAKVEQTRDATYETSVSLGDDNDQKLDLKAKIFKNKDDRFACNGGLKLQNFDSRFLNHFLKGILGFKGRIDGDITLSGLLENPITDGLVYPKNLVLYVPYTQVKYAFPPKILIGVSQGKLIIPPTAFRDVKFKRKGILQGELYHHRFLDWAMNLEVQADDLLVLDTDEKENPDYFGTAFATGDIHFKGAAKDLTIDVNAKTDENTILNIPMRSVQSIDTTDFIVFTPPKAPREEDDFFGALDETEPEAQSVGNLKFHMNLNATKAAMIRITLDETNGSYLTGRGEGNLEFQANAYGDFNLYGTYEVSQGVYHFNFGNLISKRFTVEKGGTINWNGDPYRAILNINARYDTRVSNLGDYLDNKALNGNIDVALKLQLLGDLKNPNFRFQIALPQAGQATEAGLQAHMQSEDEEIRQFGSILATRKFNTRSVNPGIGLAGNAMEVLFNQLGDVFSNISDRVNVGLEYAQGDERSNTADEFEVNLTTRFKNRITLKTDWGIPLGNRKASDFRGEFEVLYDLNRERSFQFSAFNRRSNLEDFSSRNGGYKQGIGIQYSQNFSSLKELIRKIFKPKRRSKRVKEQRD